MNSFILINGIAFWVLFIVFVIGFIVFILLGNGYLAAQRKLDLKDRQLRNLKADYNSLLSRYKKATFCLPDFNEEKGNGKS